MESTLPRPPYDKELGVVFAGLRLPPNITPEFANRRNRERYGRPIHLACGALYRRPQYSVSLSIFRSTNSKPGGQTYPELLWIHGGGFFSGSRYANMQPNFDLVTELGAVCIFVDNRLAPECPDPAPWKIATPRLYGRGRISTRWESVPPDS